MGVESFLLTSSLLGVLAQRLVRVICPHCKEPTEPDEKLLASMGLTPDQISAVTLFAGKGCEECRFTGFLGRTGILEYLPVDEDIRGEITSKSSTEKIKEVALEEGMITLRQDGWNKVLQGITTVSEVLRVTLER
jgi:type II secretory ATPase GspE/PulE/Tfp pilus assembly ATPase PilB-like protein